AYLLAQDSSRIGVQVTPFSITGNVPPEEAQLLNNALESELARFERLKVFGVSDLQVLLNEAKQRKQLGCEAEAERCLLEIAGALGASWIASGTIGSLGTAHVLTLRLRDMRRQLLLGTLTASTGSDPAALFSTLHQMVVSLVT